MADNVPLDPTSIDQAPPLRAPEVGNSSVRQDSSGYGYGSNVLGEQEVHLLDYVRVLYKRRWTAGTAFLTVFVAVTIYVFTATPLYVSRAQILIEKENVNVVTFKEAVEQNQITDDYYQTQYRLLQSRALARRTLDSLQLWNHPQFSPQRTNTISVGALLRATVATIGAWFTTPAPAEESAADETKGQSAAIDRFLDALTVSPIRNSRLVDVKFESPDAALSAHVANALAKAYIEQNLEFKFTSSKEASDWLSERLGEQRKQVEASEQALQQYREQTDSVALEDKQNIVVQKLADLNTAVTRAKTERLQKEALYNQIVSLQDDRAAIETFPAILSNTFIQQQKGELAELQRQQAQLSHKLGPHHPDMVKLGLAIQTVDAKLQGEIAKVVQATRNDYQAALAQEQSLVKALDQQKRDALELNRKGIGYSALQRDAVSNRQIFDGLLQRTKETGISGDLKTSHIRVVDAAEKPRAPSSPNRRMDLVLGLIAGLAVAIGLSFFFEYIDNRIKSPEEIRGHLGLTHLGMLPMLQQKGDRYPLLSGGVPANFSEALRTFRTNVLFSSAEEGGRALVVTSTAPREGKSLVSSNLAISLAQAGERTLLIDADLRKPKAHDIFGLSEEPGLSNVLVGDAPMSAAVRETTVPGLSVLVAGRIPPNPSELLGASRFRELMTTLGKHFDWIIVDTPPVMAVADATLVAHLATGVVFVVGAEMTSRHAAKRALDQLEHVHAKFVGGVLNKVDLHRNSYYYSQY
ncbi:MAG TPA: polysaccharide biosynthesis tyrosine autokinase, partial [Vicinamibacterales bacterium]|nr:polysaccharide biosynthesis tyrosine autokinase [Vicinamibacterales bacterium]